MQLEMGRFSRRLCMGAVAMLAAAALIGCAERTDELDRSDELMSQRDREANAALATAEAALEAEDINGFNFRDVGQLDQLPEVLPDPEKLRSPEAQAAVETAMGSFYTVLDIYDEPVAAPALGAPAQADEGDVEIVFSDSDRMLTHIELGYLYVLDAVCRLQRAGGDLFEVERLEGSASGQVYRFRLKVDVQGMTPRQILALFSDEQRQALVDAVRLLVDVTVRAEGLGPDLDVTLFRASATYHIMAAAQVISDAAPELEEAANAFADTVDDLFAAEIVAQLEEWGFVIEGPAQ